MKKTAKSTAASGKKSRTAMHHDIIKMLMHAQIGVRDIVIRPVMI